MDYLYTKRRVRIADIENGSLSRQTEGDGDGLHILTLYGQYDEYADIIEIENNRLPLPEREFVIDADDLLYIRGIKFRPVKILTRAECNTIAGRTRLLEWEQSRPYIDDDKEVSGVRMEAAPIHGKPFTKTTKHTPQDTIEYILFVNYSEFIPSPTQNYIYNGLWTWDTSRGLLSRASACEGYHPDLMFAAIEGHDIANRDEFRQVVERYAVDVDFDATQSSSKRNRITLTREQVVGKLMEIYDNSQHLIDCLFATYELFRTEQYAAIKDMPLTARRVAIRNFLATFWAYNSKSGLNTRISNATPIRYKGAVAANVRRRLNIPDEVFNYANKTFHTEPLTDPIPKEQKQDANTNLRGFYTSKEARKQTDPVQTKMIFALNKVELESTPEKLSGKTIKQALAAAMKDDVLMHKLFVNLMAAVQSDPSFDIKAIARRVAESKTTNDLDDLTSIPITINALDLIKDVWRGRQSINNAVLLEQILRNLPSEPFIHYPLYTYKNKKSGNEISVRIDSTNIKKYRKKGYQAVAYLAPRFGFVGWKFKLSENDYYKEVEETDKDGKVIGKKRVLKMTPPEIQITVNALHYTAMYDENGNLTNYDYFSPQYKEYTNSIDNDVMQYAYPTERLIFKEYDRHFKVAKTSVGRAIIKAKTENVRLSKEEIAAIRHNAEIITINKQSFYEQVLAYTNRTPDDIVFGEKSKNKGQLDRKQKQRIIKQIDDALRRMVEYGVLIKEYSSTPDGSAWNIKFVEPNRPSI